MAEDEVNAIQVDVPALPATPCTDAVIYRQAQSGAFAEGQLAVTAGWTPCQSYDGVHVFHVEGRAATRQIYANATGELPRVIREQRELEKSMDPKAMEARRKARRLLVDNLSPSQRQTFKRHGFFYVRAQSGNEYRIERAFTHNVKLIKGRRKKTTISTYCAHPNEPVPTCDSMLAQKLMLEADERGFLDIANIS